MDSLNVWKTDEPDLVEPIKLTKASNVKKSVKRCQFDKCKKKLHTIDRELACKCGKAFCNNHRIAIEHDCKFDYCAAWKIKCQIDEQRKFKFVHRSSDGGVC